MIILRIPAALLERIRKDLRRRHEFAAERNGFLFAWQSKTVPGSHLLLGAEYWAIPDDCYIDDPATPSRFNSIAIRVALQRALDTGMSALTIHEHAWKGRPRFSPTDEKELRQLMPSFAYANARVPHGALVLGLNAIAGQVWLGSGSPQPISEISVVGFPLIKSI